MRLNNTINAKDIETEDDVYSLIPEGIYNSEIISAILKSTKAGNGQYLNIGFKITGPTHAGRTVYANLNIQNPSEVAQKIGLQQLKQLMDAIKLPSLEDTDQLVGCLLNIRITIKRQPDTQWPDSNEVKKFLPPSMSVGKTVFPTTAKYDNPDKAPWE